MAVIDEIHENTPSSEAVTDTNKLSVDERIAKAEEFKTKGNQLFGEQNFTAALKEWHYALLYSAGINSFATLYGARSTEEQNAQAMKITSAVFNNMTACYLKQERWEKAVFAASKVLESEPKNLKALYRRTQAYLKLGRTVTAAKDLDRALDISPNDPTIRSLGEQLLNAYEAEEKDTQGEADATKDEDAQPKDESSRDVRTTT